MPPECIVADSRGPSSRNMTSAETTEEAGARVAGRALFDRHSRLGNAAAVEALARAVAAAYLGRRATAGRLLGCGDQGCAFEAVPSRRTRGSSGKSAVKVSFPRAAAARGREALALCAVATARDSAARALAPAIRGHATGVRATTTASPADSRKRRRVDGGEPGFVVVAGDVVEMELVRWPAASRPESAAAAARAAAVLRERAGVDHGDIATAGNVVASPDDATDVRLLDFGVATFVDARARTRAVAECARLARPSRRARVAPSDLARRSTEETGDGATPERSKRRLEF